MESCWDCRLPVDHVDHYCRHCGQGQGAFVAWYYRPLWIAVLTLTALGPFVLPLVWRTPRLDRTAKVIASVIVIGVSIYVVYVGWRVVVDVREIGRNLDDL